MDKKDCFTKEHLGLVKAIAIKVKSGLPPHIELDDLIGEGKIGLVDAVNRYEKQPGVEFKNYAGIRIRGAILDYLRKEDQVSRHDRRILSAMKELEEEAAREDLDFEAPEQNIPIEYHLVSLDTARAQYKDDPVSGGLHQVIADKNLPPELEYLYRDQYQKRKDALERAKESGLLNQNEIAYIALASEGFKQLDIAKVLGLTEGRVSQIKEKIIEKVRKRQSAEKILRPPKPQQQPRVYKSTPLRQLRETIASNGHYDRVAKILDTMDGYGEISHLERALTKRNILHQEPEENLAFRFRLSRKEVKARLGLTAKKVISYLKTPQSATS